MRHSFRLPPAWSRAAGFHQVPELRSSGDVDILAIQQPHNCHFEAEGNSMSLKVIGAGVGRTGTNSLKLAINRLGFGPCHHMRAVALNQEVQVPLWLAAANGVPDWSAIFDGYESAVGWPTVSFFRELNAVCPSAKFILTLRDADNWVESFSQTIYRALAQRDRALKQLHPWFDMSGDIIAKTGFPPGLDEEAMKTAFLAHNQAVKAAIPADRLLVYQVKEGWEPLCAFLDVPVPDDPFPRTNDRAEFWGNVGGVT